MAGRGERSLWLLPHSGKSVLVGDKQEVKLLFVSPWQAFKSFCFGFHEARVCAGGLRIQRCSQSVRELIFYLSLVPYSSFKKKKHSSKQQLLFSFNCGVSVAALQLVWTEWGQQSGNARVLRGMARSNLLINQNKKRKKKKFIFEL